MPQVEQYGVLVSCLRILMNSILMTVVHMALVYGILYFFIPRYDLKSRNKIGTTVLLILFVIIIACFNYLNFLLTFAISTRMGFFDKMPGMDFIAPIWLRQIIINYPTIIGFAVAIKLSKRWYLKQEETAQLVREKINAELLLLKSQVHPHFLFNTLNNIYSFILNGSSKTPEMIKALSSLLHYILNDCDRPFVPLEKEISMIKDYVELEKIRYGDKLNMNLHIQGDPSGKLISPLLLIPFVENSFKHGTSRMLTHPWIRLEISIDNNSLNFGISNNRPERQENFPRKGIGLANVKKRLELLYPNAHSLSIIESEMSYDVSVKIALYTVAKSGELPGLKDKEIYELA
ncbi:MAG TPA: histidine kinase [Chitinophagaceae bacterium]|nr:histidine kinase [Chitinophagaceae bacterium]